MAEACIYISAAILHPGAGPVYCTCTTIPAAVYSTRPSPEVILAHGRGPIYYLTSGLLNSTDCNASKRELVQFPRPNLV